MPDRLHILMPNLEYPPLGGGAAPVTQGLARALVARGHQVDVVTMGYRELPPEQDDYGVRVFRVPCLRSHLELSYVHELATYVWSGLRKVKWLVGREDYDLCHCHFLLPTGLIPYVLSRSPRFPPYLVTSHGSDIPGFNPDRFLVLHRFSPPILRRILRKASGLIVPSAALEHLIHQNFNGDVPPLTRIPNGIDPSEFVPRPKEPRVMVATRLFERKGVQRVIEALAAIPEHGHQLEVAGDGPQRTELEEQARSLGVPAHFYGWLAWKPLCSLYERSKIFVLASTSDNFPVSLLEAMAARCAVITTRAGGCPEVVGNAGIIVEAGDLPGLREALTRLIKEPGYASELGERARRRVAERFGWEPVAALHETAYEATLRRVPSAEAFDLPTPV